MPYINYEISGCLVTESHTEESTGRLIEYVETCPDEDATFFTVYGRLPNGEAEALKDFDTKEAAEQFYNELKAEQK